MTDLDFNDRLGSHISMTDLDFNDRLGSHISMTDLDMSLGSHSCPAGENICNSSISLINKPANTICMVSRNIFNHRPLLGIAFVVCFIGFSLGEITKPSNLAAAKDTEVQMNCSMNSDVFGYWYHRNPKDNYNTLIASNTTIEGEWFAVIESRRGHVTLLFKSQYDTSGRYTCLPFDMNKAKGFTAEMIVLDAKPTCSKEEIPGFVRANCSIGYSGYWDPKLEWYKLSERLETNDMHTETNRKVTSSVTVPFNKADPGASYTLTCTPKFYIENKPPETTATNVPEFPASCSLRIGALEGEEAQSLQSNSSIPLPSSACCWRSRCLPCICLSTMVFLEMVVSVTKTI